MILIITLLFQKKKKRQEIIFITAKTLKIYLTGVIAYLYHHKEFLFDFDPIKNMFFKEGRK